MQFVRTALLCTAIFLSGFAVFTSNAKEPKPPEVEVTDMAIHREGGLIAVDTTLKNVGSKPIRGLTAIYHFFAPGHLPITTQRTETDEPVLNPGVESTIHAQLGQPARATEVEFSAVDASGRELRVKNAGPFPIE